MKKILILISLLILSVSAYSQVRGLMVSKTSKTTIDTVNFDFYIWKMMVMVEGNYTDTLYFWFEDKPANSSRYFYLIGVDPPLSLSFTSSINKVYIRGNTTNIKYRIYGLP